MEVQISDTAYNQPMVSVDQLERRFGEFIAVNKISFEVNRGEVFGFLGPNGAGKSTTIRMLCGILSPSGGRGVVAGFDIGSQPEKVKKQIGYMSQRFSLYEDLTVEENIDFYMGIYRVPAKRRRDRKEWVISMAELQDHRGSITRILSGGWKQRLALGCAILHEPPVIFLDEPTSGVDPVNRRRFWDLIYELSNEGRTIFVSTHYMDEAEYCHRIGLIYRGELIAMGTPHQLKERFMREEILQVECSNPQNALEVLRGTKGIKDVALFGEGLHIVVADAEASMPVIKGLLNKGQFHIHRIEKIPPSLEDVFISLIEARDLQEQPIEETTE